MPRRKKKSTYTLLENVPRIILAPFILFLVILLGIAVIQASSLLFYKNEVFPQGVKYVPDQILARYKSGSSPEELLAAGKTQERDVLLSRLSQNGIVSQRKLFTGNDEVLQNYYLFSLKKGTSIPDAYQRISKIPQIEAAAPDYILKIQATPSDPQFSDQWDLKMIDAPGAWDTLKTKGKVTVAVIDTGVDYSHEDLAGNVIRGPNILNNSQNPMDDHGHGTHVAGIIGALTDNGKGVASTSWGAKIMAIKACDKDGNCNTSDISRAMKYAIDHGVKVINVSIAGTGACQGTYADMLSYAAKHKVLVVAAAGNGNNGDGVGVDVKTQIPGSCEGVLAVGSVDAQGNRSSFSNFGPKVEISAPGGSGPCTLQSCVLSTGINNGYMLRAGTSMAAPHVSAVAALLLSFNPSYDPGTLKSCMVRSADTIHTDHPVGGRLNARRAVLLCGLTNVLAPTATPSLGRKNSYSIYGSIFIDGNNNGIMDGAEKKLTGAQVVLSGSKSDSVLSNNTGRYIFTTLSPGLYTVSLSYNGQPIALPEDVVLTTGSTSKELNLAVSPNLLTGTTPGPVQKAASLECFIDPACASNKDTLQVCSFQCSYR
ncbi:MAG: S8 family serine peptidase [Candidatus Levyibacteriota bacterium]